MLPDPVNVPVKLTVIDNWLGLVFVIVTPEGTDHVYPVAPATPVVLYTTPVCPHRLEIGPEINAGWAGVERTATVLVGPFPQGLPPYILTLPDKNPIGNVMLTLNIFPAVVNGLPVFTPSLIVAPAGAVHVSEEAPPNGVTAYV